MLILTKTVTHDDDLWQSVFWQKFWQIMQAMPLMPVHGSLQTVIHSGLCSWLNWGVCCLEVKVLQLSQVIYQILW